MAHVVERELEAEAGPQPVEVVERALDLDLQRQHVEDEAVLALLGGPDQDDVDGPARKDARPARWRLAVQKVEEVLLDAIAVELQHVESRLAL